MTSKQALTLLIKEIELQDPTGNHDTLEISSKLAEVLLTSDDLDVPRDVMQQDGFEALQRVGLLGYDVQINESLRGFAVDVLTKRED